MIDIDRIARHSIDTEPSADLEARVLARLDAEPARGRRRTWPVWAMAGGVMAVAAAGLIGVLGSGSPGVLGSRRPGVLGSGSPGVLESGSPGVLGSGSPGVLGSRGVPAVATAEAGPEVEKTAELTVEELAWMDRRLPALPVVEELWVDFLEYESIQPEALSIAPLIMTALPTDGAGMERHH